MEAELIADNDIKQEVEIIADKDRKQREIN